MICYLAILNYHIKPYNPDRMNRTNIKITNQSSTIIIQPHTIVFFTNTHLLSLLLPLNICQNLLLLSNCRSQHFLYYLHFRLPLTITKRAQVYHLYILSHGLKLHFFLLLLLFPLFCLVNAFNTDLFIGVFYFV